MAGCALHVVMIPTEWLVPLLRIPEVLADWRASNPTKVPMLFLIPPNKDRHDFDFPFVLDLFTIPLIRHYVI